VRCARGNQTHDRAGRACSGPLRVSQALFVVHKTLALPLLAMEQTPEVMVRLVNHGPSEMHMRQLKSSTIGACAAAGAQRPPQACGCRGQGVAAGSTCCWQLATHALLCAPAHASGLVLAGKLATVKGTVVRMSHVRPLMVEMTFSCNRCGCTMGMPLADGRYTPPTACGGARVCLGGAAATGGGGGGGARGPGRRQAGCFSWSAAIQ
jgi:hypothetical protein